MTTKTHAAGISKILFYWKVHGGFYGDIKIHKFGRNLNIELNRKETKSVHLSDKNNDNFTRARWESYNICG